jgi:hypothetical protein
MAVSTVMWAAPQGPSEQTEGDLINVTMDGAAVRIRPVGRLDGDLADTITMLLESARIAGTDAYLDLSELDWRDREAARSLAEVTPASVA